MSQSLIVLWIYNQIMYTITDVSVWGTCMVRFVVRAAIGSSCGGEPGAEFRLITLTWPSYCLEKFGPGDLWCDPRPAE